MLLIYRESTLKWDTLYFLLNVDFNLNKLRFHLIEHIYLQIFEIDYNKMELHILEDLDNFQIYFYQQLYLVDLHKDEKLLRKNKNKMHNLQLLQYYFQL